MKIEHRGLKAEFSEDVVRDLVKEGTYKDAASLRKHMISVLDEEANFELKCIEFRKDLTDAEKMSYKLRFGRTSESPQVTTG